MNTDAEQTLLPDTLTRARLAVISILTILVALFRFWARAKSLWDWDEALFCLAIRDYNVALHHPHPPGFPLFIGAAKVLVAAGAGDFQALQLITVISAIADLSARVPLAREMRLSFGVSLSGALLLSAMPNVTIYGGTAFSDVPSLALSLAAVLALLRGRSSRSAYLAGAVLLGLAVGIRVQNLLIGFAPSLLATVPRLRANWKDVVAAMLIGLAIIGVCYGAAVKATGSWADYRDTVKAHGEYIERVDSWRGPDRPPLGEVLEIAAVRPFRAASLMSIVSALALVSLIDLAVNRHRPTLLLLITFLPFMITAWLLLDWISMSRFSIAYIGLHAILAARGLEIVAAMLSTWLRSPVAANFAVLSAAAVVALVIYTLPAVRIVRGSPSPPVEAFAYVREHYNPKVTRVFTIQGQTDALADLMIPEFERAVVRSAETIPLARDGRDSIVVVEADWYGAAKSFHRTREKHLARVVRDRYFEMSVVPVENSILFEDGFYDPEGDSDHPLRWMAARGKVVVAASGRARTLRLTIELPSETVGKASLTFSCNGVRVATIKPDAAVFTQTIELPVGNASNEIELAVDATVRPSDVDPESKDTRDLGARILTVELK